MIDRRLTCLVLLGACAPQDPVPAETHAEDPAGGGVTNRLAVPATVRENLGIEFTTVEVRHVTRSLRIPGHFELTPRARREVRMALSGRIELLVDALERVEVGQVLFRFQSSAWAEKYEEVLQAEQAIAAAVAEAAVAAARLAEAERQLAVLRGRLADLAAAELRRADLEVEAAQLEASLPRLAAERSLADVIVAGAEQTHEHALHHAAIAVGLDPGQLTAHSEPLVWIEVTAAAPGVVETLAVTDGSFVEEAGLVLTTVQPDRLRFRALALQADLPRLSGEPRARIVPPSELGEAVPATVELGLAGEVPVRTIVVWAAPEAHAPWMRAGVAAFLEVVLEESRAGALVVPRDAVVRDGLVHVLFRRDPSDPDAVLRVEADLGVDDGEWVVLESGVMGGDEVVTAGAFELRLATQQQGGTAKGGHFHSDGTFHEED